MSLEMTSPRMRTIWSYKVPMMTWPLNGNRGKHRGRNIEGGKHGGRNIEGGKHRVDIEKEKSAGVDIEKKET
jgi:hypothetical protein